MNRKKIEKTENQAKMSNSNVKGVKQQKERSVFCNSKSIDLDGVFFFWLSYRCYLPMVVLQHLLQVLVASNYTEIILVRFCHVFVTYSPLFLIHWFSRIGRWRSSNTNLDMTTFFPALQVLQKLALAMDKAVKN